MTRRGVEVRRHCAPHQVSPEKSALLASEVASGKGYATVAREQMVTESTVRRHCRRHSVVTTRLPSCVEILSEDAVVEVWLRFRDGTGPGIREEAALLGVHRSTLYLRLQRYVRHWRRTRPPE